MPRLISESLWNFMLFPMLFCGVLLSLRSGFFQLKFKKIFSLILPAFKEKNSRRAVFTTLAATMGTGNIIGVAAAVSTGGAGAVFWMWVSAFFGMGIAFAENFLAVRFGGAVTLLEKGVKCKPLAVAFAIFCVLSSFGVGNMAQSASGASAISAAFGINPVIIAATMAIIAFFVIIGGAKSIGSFAEKIIPILSVLYIFMSILVIVYNFKTIPSVFADIFLSAFGLKSVVGGAVGVTVKTAVTTGLSRGVFSNEAGLGSAGIIHSFSGDNCAERQGALGIIEVFADTIVCCTITALAVLSYNDYLGKEPATLVIEAFSSVLGKYSGAFVALSIFLFALATVIGWEFIGEYAWSYLFKSRSIVYYKYIYIIFILVGATIPLQNVFYIADIFNALMALPNLFALTALFPKNAKDTVTKGIPL